MIEKPTSEWIESVAQLFPPRPPKAIKLRGDGESIHYSQYEVSLARIHHLTKQYYKEQHPKLPYYKVQKHLSDQERTLYLMCYNFGVSTDEVISQGSFYKDFVVRPSHEASYFELGLADLIFISDLTEIPFILEFHLQNHVLVEKTDVLYFLQILRNYVPHFLKTRYPIVDRSRIEMVVNNTFSMVSNLTDELKKEYYWYKKEYKEPVEIQEHDFSKGTGSKQPDANTIEKFEDIQDATINEGINDEAEIDEQLEDSTGNQTLEEEGKLPLQYHCTQEVLVAYFNLLCPESDGKKQYLNQEGVNYILCHYFGYGPNEGLIKPDFNLSMNRNEVVFFFKQYYDKLTRKGGGRGTATLKDLLRIPIECFPYYFSDLRLNSLYSNTNKFISESHIPDSHPLRLKNNKELADAISGI